MPRFGVHSTMLVERDEPVLRTEEDVDEILRLAVRHQGAGPESLRERLERTALEVGIAPEALEAAEAEYRAAKARQAEEEELQADWRAFRRRKRQHWLGHLASYLAVNAGLFTLNILTSGRPTWVLWVLAGWGIGLLADAASAFAPSKEQEQEFRRWRKRKRA
jgi:hypothetical protein